MLGTQYGEFDVGFSISKSNTLMLVGGDIRRVMEHLIRLIYPLRIKTVWFHYLHVSSASQNIIRLTLNAWGEVGAVNDVPVWVRGKILCATAEGHGSASVLVMGSSCILSLNQELVETTSARVEAKWVVHCLDVHLLSALDQNVVYQLDDFHAVKISKVLRHLPIYIFQNRGVLSLRRNSLSLVIVPQNMLLFAIGIFRLLRLNVRLRSLRCWHFPLGCNRIVNMTQIEIANLFADIEWSINLRVWIFNIFHRFLMHPLRHRC